MAEEPYEARIVERSPEMKRFELEASGCARDSSADEVDRQAIQGMKSRLDSAEARVRGSRGGKDASGLGRYGH